MNAPYITTSVYKYKPYAFWLLGVYCILIVALFLFSSSLPSTVVGIGSAILLLIPIYAAIKPKSIFSIRYVDERKLSIGAESILWDSTNIPVSEVMQLSIYLFAFEDFRHREKGGSRTGKTEDGDQNKLSFIYQDKKYDFTFFIGNYRQYQTILQIIRSWRESGYEVSARSAFDYSFIKKEVEYFANR